MHMKKIVAFFMIVLMCLSGVQAVHADKKSSSPILDPATVRYVQTKDDFLNILFLGLDVTAGDIHASGNKRTVMKSHTDVIMLLAINKTKGRMDLLSIPRDTLCYVPGVYGVYKINAAFNTATNPAEGLRHVRDTVSWFLGGIKIDAYCAVDLQAMKTLTDKMGGIDFEVDMNYTGSSGKKYKIGYQHLDGMGVVDYVRARKNATREANDMGRTTRNRKMMIAIFDKLKSDMNMINELWAESQKSSVNFYTDMNGIRVITDLWDFFQGIESAEIGSHMIPGVYEDYVLGYWSLNITDQAERTKIIKNLFGFTAKELPYTSKNYCRWLLNGGFQAIQNIRQARLILDYARLRPKPSKDLQSAISALDKAIDAAVTAFDKAGSQLRASSNKDLTTACKKMRTAAEKVVKLSNYSKAYTWEKAKLWYQDPLINEYNKIEWK